MKKVLLVTCSDLAIDGVVSYNLTWTQNAPKDISFSWYFTGKIKDYDISKKLDELNVQKFPGNRDRTKRSRFLIVRLYRIFKELNSMKKDISDIESDNDFDVIHISTGSHQIAAALLKKANKLRISQRIIYCINNPSITSWRRKIANKYYFKIINKYATRLSACSKDTAKYLYGEYSNKAIVINPCADCKKFIFSQESRDRIRKQYNAENNFVVGNIARLDPQKNHKFLIEIFKEISTLNDNARLMLVGGGPLESDIRNWVNESGLTDKVIFCGSTDKPEDYFCAMDVFVFPCIFEGLGQVAIHAQNSGLRTICSEEVPRETAVTELAEYLPLTDSPKKWAEKILSYNNGYERKNMYEEIKKADYDISSIPKWIDILYGE